MNQDLQKAADILQQQNLRLVLCREGNIVTDTRRGIQPLLDLADSGKDFKNYSAADKVVGKAAALLYCYLGVKAVYTPVISLPALQILRQAEIETTALSQVPAIQNRTGTGLCPMESAVWEISDSAEAISVIRKTLAKLQG